MKDENFPQDLKDKLVQEMPYCDWGNKLPTVKWHENKNLLKEC